MSETPYTLRELDTKLETKFERVCDLITEKCNDIVKTQTAQSLTLEEVKTEVKKTNGRVTALETVNAEKRGSGRVLLAIYSLSVTLLIGYLGWVGLKIEEVQARNDELQAQIPSVVRDSVAEALLPYAK
jgi:hypothetical protein